MTPENRTKLNELISDWPKGAVYTAEYLRKKGYRYDLLRHYKLSRWLAQVGNGAYKLFNDKVEWYGGLYALQKQLKLHIHAGGKTALELRGFGHYVEPVEFSCFLFGAAREKLPKWFAEYDWSVKIIHKATKLLPPQVKRIVREFGISMQMQRYSGFPPQLFDKIEKEHISKSLEIAAKDDERHYKYATHGRLYTLIYVLIAIGVFVFLTYIFGNNDLEFYKEIVKTLLIFGAGLGTGFGLKSYKERKNGK